MAPKTGPLCFVAFLLLWLASGCNKTQAQAPDQAPAPTHPSAMTVDLHETAVTEMKLLSDRVAVAPPGGGRADTRVALTRTDYEVSARAEDPAFAPGRPGVLYCYELRSLDEGVPFAWSTWSPSVLQGKLQVLTNEKGENFLVAVDMEVVRLTSIGVPRGKVDSLMKYLAGYSSMLPVVVTRILGQEPFRTGSANFEDAHQVSVLGASKDTSGGLTNGDWILTVAGVDKTKTFRLRFGVLTGQWRAD